MIMITIMEISMVIKGVAAEKGPSPSPDRRPVFQFSAIQFSSPLVCSVLLLMLDNTGLLCV